MPGVKYKKIFWFIRFYFYFWGTHTPSPWIFLGEGRVNDYFQIPARSSANIFHFDHRFRNTHSPFAGTYIMYSITLLLRIICNLCPSTALPTGHETKDSYNLCDEIRFVDLLYITLYNKYRLLQPHADLPVHLQNRLCVSQQVGDRCVYIVYMPYNLTLEVLVI